MNEIPLAAYVCSRGDLGLKDTYKVYQNGNVVGEATVIQEGLYYHLICLCRLHSTQIHRVIISCDQKDIDLGICVPMGNSFCLEKRIPVKRIGNGPFAFRVEQRVGIPVGEFFPIVSTQPFLHVSELERARFERRNGEAGILIIS